MAALLATPLAFAPGQANAAGTDWARTGQTQVRLISAVNRIFKACGLNDLEQIEDAPEYRPGVTVTPELVEQFLAGRIKVEA